ncbi:16S rRNA (cytidine(1402)-2'-O)-methyltransferase [Falsarthrobacter nasiphocae]|uniref:Ribosomal RNA small subunit methyltransferase I n=1 Tax=Falsarthrobacter nasiphocae TaxID=189863 RepID=A0AAE3YD00_9MICC|nr:16S rRNA (cytidine(1402)-2'-O)-methyltransferase [Falsarthrobacter nasiphocae]MDR6891618.1 16S rRNA (cytidine1402-2'-O)-methyltransferase [Falsarthrobacter nasiphocae]
MSPDTASAGRIVLAGTPIGNLGDASPRLSEILQGADVIAAEDTRTFQRLQSALGLDITARVLAHHEHNEETSAAGLVDLAEAGAEVVLVTDAGMPAVSDPGYRLVRLAAERGVTVTCVPGPSAAITALAVSGIASDRFAFEGFLPRKTGERRSRLSDLSGESRTLVFFEAPHRIDDMLEDLALAFGPSRPAAVCREMTKHYEQVLRGTLADLAERATAEQLRGEIVVVVEGAPERGEEVGGDMLADVERLVAGGHRLKDACAVVAERHRLPKREVYQAVLASRGTP